MLKEKNFNLDDALYFLKKNSSSNFDESVDISLKLFKNFNKLNKIVNGVIFFSYNIVKFNRVLVFANGMDAIIAKEMGIKNVGLNNLIDVLNDGFCDFDLIVVSFKYLSYFENFIKNFSFLNSNQFIFESKIITNNIKDSLYKLKIGKTNFKSDKNGVINLSIGKCSFKLNFLKFNFFEIINFIKKNFFLNYKKKIFSKITLSSTMGIGLNINF